jgi:hypothetical protein
MFILLFLQLLPWLSPLDAPRRSMAAQVGSQEVFTLGEVVR